MKDSFVFRREWRDAISGMSAEMRLEFYEAVIEYATTGNEPNLKPMARLAFNFAKATLDKDVERYNQVSNARKEAANKRWNKEESNANACKPMQSDAKNTIAQYDNDSDNDIIKEEPPKGGKKKDALSSSSPTVLMQERKIKFIESLDEYTATYGKEMIEDFINYWTEPNKSQTKMRYELERTWDTARRLVTWAKNEAKYGVDKSSSKRAKTDETARQVREEREANTQELLKSRDEWAKKSVSLEEARKSDEYMRAMAEA